MSSFKKFQKGDIRRLKMLLFGDTGSGKTITALQMPDPAVVDTERGCDWYMDKFSDAGFVQTSDPNTIREIIRETMNDPGEYKTLVVDSFTVFQEAIEERHLNRKRAEKNNPSYVFTPLDYKFIKNSVKSIILDLLAVDMNIVCTARSKPIYDKSGDDMIGQIVGFQPDVRKEVPYLFDVVIELIDDDGVRKAVVHKDRTNTLDRVIHDFNYQKLAAMFGEEDLQREPVKLRADKELNQRRNRNTEITLGSGKQMFTAGVTAETLDAIIILAESVDKDLLREKIMEDYGQDGVASLREDEAQLLLKDLNGEIEYDN